MAKHNVLIVDDNTTFLEMIKDCLKEHCKVFTATNSKDAFEFIENKKFAVIILDVKLQEDEDIDGFGIAEIIRSSKKNKSTSMLFLSALLVYKEHFMECYKYGIVDYLVKPFIPELLLAKVKVFLQIYQKEQVIKEQRKALLKLATIDELTQVYNRRRFNELTDFEVTVVKRYHRPLTLIMFDIDHFKVVNDTYGHVEGDKILYELAQFIKKHKRKADRLFRYGGEEFAILCPETPAGNENAQTVAERLREKVEKHKFCDKYKLTISLGATEFKKTRDNMESFVQRADKALYKAKHNGRNRTEVIL